MKKIVLLLVFTTLISFTNAQSLNCGSFCILSIGNINTANKTMDVTIYNGDTNHVNYPVVVVTDNTGDTVANINNSGYFFIHPAMDTLTHTIPTTLNSMPSNFTGTIYITDDAYNITCSIPYPSMKCTVGINELLAKKSSINVFPNPVSKTINIQLGNMYSGSRINLRDLSGKIVISVSAEKNLVSIDRGDLPSGIYFLEALKENQRSIKKIILE